MGGGGRGRLKGRMQQQQALNPAPRPAFPHHHHHHRHRRRRPPAMLPTKEQSCSLLMPPPTEMAPPTLDAVFSMNEQAVKLAEPPAGKGEGWVLGGNTVVRGMAGVGQRRRPLAGRQSGRDTERCGRAGCRWQGPRSLCCSLPQRPIAPTAARRSHQSRWLRRRPAPRRWP